MGSNVSSIHPTCFSRHVSVVSEVDDITWNSDT